MIGPVHAKPRAVRGVPMEPLLRSGEPVHKLAGNIVPADAIPRAPRIVLPSLRRSAPIRRSIGGFDAAMGSRWLFRPQLILRQTTSVPNTVTDISHALLSYDIDASLNDSMASARIRLRFVAGGGLYDFSPLNSTSSYIDGDGRPLLDPGTEVMLLTAVDDPDSPGSGSQETIFYGRLDRVNMAAAPGVIELACRDAGAFYQNVTIETGTKGSIKYGTPEGREASLVMQDILQDHGFDPLDLFALAPDDWMVLEYAQGEIGLLDALRAIAQQAGRDVRYFNSIGKLVYYEPARATLTADLYLPPSRYESITDLQWGDEDVRNYWEVYWQGTDGAVNGPVIRYDDESIARYGNGRRRKARITLNRADNIRDADAAIRFAEAALADTKDPFVSHGIQAPGLPMVELNDVHYYPPNSDEYNTSVIVAVATYHHHYENGHMTTTISGRGNRIAAYRDYRRSVAPKQIVSTVAANDDDGMPEGTAHYQVTDLAFP